MYVGCQNLICRANRQTIENFNHLPKLHTFTFSTEFFSTRTLSTLIIGNLKS